MMKRAYILLITTVMLFGCCEGCYALSIDSIKTEREKQYYNAYEMLHKMLQTGNNDFGMAVFYVEKAYNKSLSYETFYNEIKSLAHLAEDYRKNTSSLYPYYDSLTVHKNASIFKVLTDTIKTIYNRKDTVYHLPYVYNMDDFDGSKDWSNMFVSTLMETHKGNCHSMPFLYKLIAQELDLKTYFALAPNHIYIKLYNKQYDWYNTELTSAEFPIDAWVMASGYIHLSSIQNGIYMDTIGDKKSIAMCLTDLAQGYQHRIGIGDGTFILKCCKTTLDYFPDYINALLLQLDVYQTLFKEKLKTSGYTDFEVLKNKDRKANELFNTIEALSQKIYNLGYRKMPESMYLKWLTCLKTEREKYANKKIALNNKKQ